MGFAVVAQDDEFCWLVAERAATASAALVPVLRLAPGLVWLMGFAVVAQDDEFCCFAGWLWARTKQLFGADLADGLSEIFGFAGAYSWYGE